MSTYRKGREVRVKVGRERHARWMDAVIVQEKPLLVEICELHPVFHGAVISPERIQVAKKRPMGAARKAVKS